MRLRWFLDLAFVKNVCVGRVHQLPAGPDSVAPGQVQKQASWVATGMWHDWADTVLGNSHPSKEVAMATVAEWHRKQSLQVKKPCSAHAQYRTGCVMCEAVNR